MYHYIVFSKAKREHMQIYRIKNFQRYSGYECYIKIHTYHSSYEDKTLMVQCHMSHKNVIAPTGLGRHKIMDQKSATGGRGR